MQILRTPEQAEDASKSPSPAASTPASGSCELARGSADQRSGAAQVAAIFDLDDTLLNGDSDYLWGEFLCEIGALDGAEHRRQNEEFLADYHAGTLDYEAFAAFQLGPLARFPPDTLHRWREQFLERVIAPRVLPAAAELIGRHRDHGHRCVIATATNRFITGPIAELLQIRELIATEVETIDGRYTGRMAGIPCSGAGKLEHVERWARQVGVALEQSWFYSDSFNDVPLLGRVGTPVATNPDARLRAHASSHGWRTLDLRVAPVTSPAIK